MPAGVTSGIRIDSSFMNLKAIGINQTRPVVNELLLQDEKILSVYQTVRDQVVFTDKRIIVINVQGLTGKKTAYMSYPYSRIQNFAVQTAGVLDIDCELLIFFVNGLALQFDFRAGVDIKSISHFIASHVL